MSELTGTRSEGGNNWWEQARWKEKGRPVEQIEFDLGGDKITIFNFNRERRLTEAQLEEARDVFEKYSSAFPETIKKVKSIIVDDAQPESVWGDEENYPQNGYSDPRLGIITLSLRALENVPHRINTISNWQGTLAHEIGHFLGGSWKGNYTWSSKSEGMERIPSPNKKRVWFREKVTGVIHPGWVSQDLKDKLFPVPMIPDKPEECVTKYATLTESEDRCEALVVFFYDPELLDRISPNKKSILQGESLKQSPDPRTAPVIIFRRIPDSESPIPSQSVA